MNTIKRNNIVVLVSGEGSNLQALIDADIFNSKITLVISNTSDANALVRARRHRISTYVHKDESDLLNSINNVTPDLIVLAGYMKLLSKDFLNNLCCPIINLHPALPGTFPGKSAIKRNFEAFIAGETKIGGVMVHHVIPEMDAGEVIVSETIYIHKDDTLESYNKRIHELEHRLIVESVRKTLKIYRGKVRDIVDIGFNLLAVYHSDRLSAFDVNICEVSQKGRALTSMSEFWFQQTRHIVPNHFIYAKDNVMIVRKARPIKIEFIVRGYMTGSLWAKYSNGARRYCGVQFDNGIIKNQRLPRSVITPTTKSCRDEPDEPLTREEIEDNHLTPEQTAFIYDKVFKLFRYGQAVARGKGLILVDTKYEFGFDEQTGEIILIDEIHTCDSSRYWIEKYYNEALTNGTDPKGLDKDLIRNYLRNECNFTGDRVIRYYDDITGTLVASGTVPTTSNIHAEIEHVTIPNIPTDLITETTFIYADFYRMISGELLPVTTNSEPFLKIVNYYLDYAHPKVAILAESEDDRWHINTIYKELLKVGVHCFIKVASVYQAPRRVLYFIDKVDKLYKPGTVVYITIAGYNNTLSGFVAANTKHSVISCPPYKNYDDIMPSSLQIPTGVPVMTILNPENAAIACRRILEHALSA